MSKIASVAANNSDYHRITEIKQEWQRAEQLRLEEKYNKILADQRELARIERNRWMNQSGQNIDRYV
jgi:hypothetical protein